MKFPKKIIKNYISAVNEKMPVSGVLLFGSYAYGKPDKNSDIDLVIISDGFKKMDFDDRLDWLTAQRDSKTYAVAMDIIGYTKKEFANIEKKSAIMAQAKKKGKWLTF